jgi:hypothetical protein
MNDKELNSLIERLIAKVQRDAELAQQFTTNKNDGLKHWARKHVCKSLGFSYHDVAHAEDANVLNTVVVDEANDMERMKNEIETYKRRAAHRSNKKVVSERDQRVERLNTIIQDFVGALSKELELDGDK